jgi:hypothetical protein
MYPNLKICSAMGLDRAFALRPTPWSPAGYSGIFYLCSVVRAFALGTPVGVLHVAMYTCKNLLNLLHKITPC